jgi:hypothetical protein
MPLHFVASSGEGDAVAVVKRLLKAGADLKAINNKGQVRATVIYPYCANVTVVFAALRSVFVQRMSIGITDLCTYIYWQML